MLPAVTLDTNTPPFSPLTMEIPSGSAPFCTVTLRGSSKYGLQGQKKTFCNVLTFVRTMETAGRMQHVTLKQHKLNKIQIKFNGKAGQCNLTKLFAL